MVGLGGLCSITAACARFGWLLLAPPAFLLGFVLIAGATTLSSISGAFLLFGTWAMGSIVAVLISIWLSKREWRRVDASPELNDRAR